jgi:hypothetical protein
VTERVYLSDAEEVGEPGRGGERSVGDERERKEGD